MPGRKSRIAMVTGASHGVGRAVALALARAGYEVVLSGRDKASLKKTAHQIELSEGRATIVDGDLNDLQTRRRLVKAAKSKISVLVHCAAGRPDPDSQMEISTTRPKDIEQLVCDTVTNTCHLIHDLSPALESAAPSHLVVLTSDWSLRGAHGPPVFSAAKAAVAQLMHTSRRSLAKRGITATIICPGDIASYDVDWEDPKWNLDDPEDQVRAELGDTRILLSDIVDTVMFSIARRSARVNEIYMVPMDADYDY